MPGYVRPTIAHRRAALLAVCIVVAGHGLAACGQSGRIGIVPSSPVYERPRPPPPYPASPRPYRDLPYDGIGTREPAPVGAPGGGRPREIVVLPGDTLFGIAQRYRVSANVLMSINNLPDGRVRVGQRLALPGW